MSTTKNNTFYKLNLGADLDPENIPIPPRLIDIISVEDANMHSYTVVYQQRRYKLYNEDTQAVFRSLRQAQQQALKRVRRQKRECLKALKQLEALERTLENQL